MKSSSRGAEHSLTSFGRSEALGQAGVGGGNTELFPWMPESLRRNAQYIHAALSFYNGGPAGADVQIAWDAITDRIAEMQATLWLLLKNRRDETHHAAVRAEIALNDAIRDGMNTHLPSVDDVRAAAARFVRWDDGDGPAESGADVSTEAEGEGVRLSAPDEQQ